MTNASSESPLSPWWRHAVILVMIAGFSLISVVTVLTYTNAPPIPQRVAGAGGATLFTRDDVEQGQAVFFRYGLMEHGSLWGHGAYLGPDYSAEYLHRLSEVARDTLARERTGRTFGELERLTFLMNGPFHTLEWARAGADAVFLVAGVVPIVFAVLSALLGSRKRGGAAG